MNFVNWCLSVVLIRLSQSVDLDYLYGAITDKNINEEETTLNTINRTLNNSIGENGRRAGDGVLSDNFTSTDDIDEEYLRERIDNFYLRTTKPKLHTNEDLPLSDATATATESYSDKTIPDLIHFQYNDYQDDTDDGNLRETLKNGTTPKVESLKLMLGGKYLSKNIDDSKRNQDFLNLEPAIESFNVTNILQVNKTVTWYVPEKFPCWDLPILYGDLGQMKTLDQVFLINPAKLKNVIDTQKLRMLVFEEGFNDFANRWCSEPPCYGDNTLCLFSMKSISPICAKGYNVKTPSPSERMTLVNVVNSLRNHVARGSSYEYPFLPSATNMKQILYDSDLESMSGAWLAQCLPGPAPCSSQRWKNAAQLECTKYAKKCCLTPSEEWPGNHCVPLEDCFIHPIVGCIYTWFGAAGRELEPVDVKCGNVEPTTYSTVQLLWADTKSIGCACGYKRNGDVRVVCHFSPGAPFILKTDYYCGLINHKELENKPKEDVVSLEYLNDLGIELHNITVNRYNNNKYNFQSSNLEKKIYKGWGIISLRKIYEENWVRKQFNWVSNGSKGLVARLVTKYRFVESADKKCDTDVPIYEIGEPASQCFERGMKYEALCYEYGESHEGYRLIAVLAPVMLFSLIMYDLFSGVMRQTTK